jgi:phosphate transport system permease protein
MSVAMIVPLVAIVTYLLVRAAPSLSWEFLVDVPRKGMREGGSGRPFVGTLNLVGLSLAVSAPIGVLAAIYLHEYAKDNWFNRVINLAVINLAGVPSIVHALFGLGAFVYAAKFGYSVLAASLTLAIMTLPVIIASTREALASVPMAFRAACWNVGASRWQTIRGRCAAQLHQRHPDRRDTSSQSRRGRDGAHHVHRCGVLQGRAPR